MTVGRSGGCEVVVVRQRTQRLIHLHALQASVRRSAGSARDRVGRPVPGRSDGSAVVSQSVAMRERRAALHLARLEPGLGFWLAKQRWLWRRDRCVSPGVSRADGRGDTACLYALTVSASVYGSRAVFCRQAALCRVFM